MYKQKKKVLVLLLGVLAMFCLAAPAWAVEIFTGGPVTVPEGKIVGPVFASGEHLVINADVDGDVFAAGQTITVNGNISGDLLAAANTIRINGTIGGDARVAASDISINGEVKQSLTAAARDLLLLEGSKVNQDALVASQNMTMSGIVGRQLLGSGENIYINGQVDDVHIWSVGQLTVGPGANVTGNINYGSTREITITPPAKITGTTTWNRIEKEEIVEHPVKFSWLAQLAWFAAGVLVWGIFALIFPRIWSSLSQNLIKKPWAGLGWGFLILLVAPLAALLLLITVVGIPLSLVLMMAYGIMIYAGKIIMADTLGRLLSNRFGWEKRLPEILPFMLGLAALILLTNIPVVGFLFNVIVTSLAFGAVLLTLYHYRQNPPAPPVNE